MEAFEHIVKVYLESQGYIATTNVKFPVRIRTKKVDREEYQTHGHEVDIVAAKSDSLILGSVKSFFGSKGVSRKAFRVSTDEADGSYLVGYDMFNKPEISKAIIEGAEQRYGYRKSQIHFCLFVGKFKSKDDEEIITKELSNLKIGDNPVKVYNVRDVSKGLLKAAESKTYIDDPVLTTLKALRQSGYLK